MLQNTLVCCYETHRVIDLQLVTLFLLGATKGRYRNTSLVQGRFRTESWLFSLNIQSKGRFYNVQSTFFPKRGHTVVP